MSIIISKEKKWYAAKWVSLKLFNDVSQFLDSGSELRKKIEFLYSVSIDTLDLSTFPVEATHEFHQALLKAISYNQDTQGKDMQSPEAFPLFLESIQNLDNILAGENINMTNHKDEFSQMCDLLIDLSIENPTLAAKKSINILESSKHDKYIKLFAFNILMTSDRDKVTEYLNSPHFHTESNDFQQMVMAEIKK